MIDSIKRRRSVREFKDKEVEIEKIREILKAAMFSPSSHAEYPWEIIVVTQDNKRKALSGATAWSSFAADAPVCFVVLGDDEKSDRWVEDTSIVSEHIWLEAVKQGLAGCWIQIRNGTTEEAGKDSEDYVKKVLNIPENWRVLSIMAVGYPARERNPHSESDYRGEKVHYEEYGSNKK